MKKGTYRAIKVNEVNQTQLAEQVRGKAITVGVDLAKEKQLSALLDPLTGETLRTVSWRMPSQLMDFVSLLRGLPASSLVVVMEPTGSYGDPLRWALAEAGIEVYRVHPKRAHDACEIYDGVPSSHDAKMAMVLAKLHRDGISERWPLPDETRRDLNAAIARLTRDSETSQRLQNQLEALLARHWPEVTELLELDSASLLELLVQIGGPAAVVRDPRRARQVLVKIGGRLLLPAKRDAVLASAGTTVGCPLTAGESALLRDLASELRRAQQREAQARRTVQRLSAAQPGLAAMGQVVGLATAAIVFCKVGDPRQFDSAAAYEKAAGLNLKERSSGQHQGQLKITKRGSGLVRQWLFLAVFRLVQKEPAFRAWYARKVEREGGKRKLKGMVALMRKLIRALWHVGQGEVFDSAKLFDLHRLGLVA